MALDFKKIRSPFTTQLLLLNDLDAEQFRSWLIKPGMAFNDLHKWWGNMGERPTPHEGTDLLLYENSLGQEHRLLPDALIPAILPGRVVKIMGDSIAQTVIICHDLCGDSGGVLHSFYAHINADEKTTIGDDLSAAAVIGRIANPDVGTGCPAHLHLSAAWIKPETPLEALTWLNFSIDPDIAGVDPLSLISS